MFFVTERAQCRLLGDSKRLVRRSNSHSERGNRETELWVEQLGIRISVGRGETCGYMIPDMSVVKGFPLNCS